MKKNILFVCEGSTEVFLLYKILKKEFKIKVDKSVENNGNLDLKKIRDILNKIAGTENCNIYIANLDGETNLNPYIEVLCNHREFGDLDKVYFIMDADSKKGEDSGFIRTKKAIENVITILKSNNGNLNTKYFITPNNNDDGMTEDILVEAIKCKVITSYIKNDVIPTLCSMEGNEITNVNKSTFMIVAATQNPLRGSAPSFITTCYNKLDSENVYLKNFILFIKESLIEN